MPAVFDLNVHSESLIPPWRAASGCELGCFRSTGDSQHNESLGICTEKRRCRKVATGDDCLVCEPLNISTGTMSLIRTANRDFFLIIISVVSHERLDNLQARKGIYEFVSLLEEGPASCEDGIVEMG